ncbi:hypothetical protein LUZ60_011933 [Juncus effusus]|nr:hypothetical protein LUZ60_011933 [Juncus effusus]
MGSVSSEDEGSDERCGSYSPSADVSGSDSSSEFSARRRYGAVSAAGGASSSFASSPLPPCNEVLFWSGKMEKKVQELSEVEMMKERFAKLLLGEDMSGSGKGVCTALAISNAITNLSATVFGELWRLEPLAPQKKSMWKRETDWLLSVSDSIVELVPSFQEFPAGSGVRFEVMVPRPRTDLYMNLPALRKLDAMLIGILEGFGKETETEFWYVDRGICLADADDDASGGLYGPRPSVRQEDKWWLPCPRVPQKGLSEGSRRKLQQCRDCANQILKAAMAINSGVLAEMEIPDVYLETLPKNGKACLGEIIHRYITADKFSPDCLLDCLDLSSEHHTLEIANRIEAAVHVWRLKSGNSKKSQQSPMKTKKTGWGGKVNNKVKGMVADFSDRSQLLSQRAEGLLLSLRLRYPGLPQTVLDMNKIQYNKDVGQSILESYSRVMESLAFNIIARIDDVIFVDDATKRSASADSSLPTMFNNRGILTVQKRISPSPFSVQNTPYGSPFGTPGFGNTPVARSPERNRGAWVDLGKRKEGSVHERD